MWTPRSRLRQPVVLIGALSWLLLSGCSKQAEPTPPRKESELRVLAWVGYDESAFIDPIEKELGTHIAVKTYVGGDQMYSLFRSAPPGTYDVVVVDAEYGKKMFGEGDLMPLPREIWKEDDLFEPFSSGTPARDGDKVFGAVVRWGALGIVYNTTRVSAEQAQDYAVLWDPALKGGVGIFDWYLPNMGVFSRFLGHQEPYDLSSGELEGLRTKLLSLRPQVRTIHQNTGDVIADLRSGEVVITPGIGEWAAAVLAEEGKPIDWSIPKQGGVLWVEALSIPTSARHVDLAKRFIAAVRAPEHAASLAWRNAYHSQVPGRLAYDHLSSAQRKLLKAENLDDLQQLINRLAPRHLPGPQTTETQWLGVWNEFKTAR